MNRKKPTNKDYGRRHYVSDDDYQTAMRRVPDKAMYNEHVIKQSEFKKPYRKDSETYEEMEYHYPDFNFPDLDWPQPNADVEGEVPGLVDYGLVHCFFDPCYCPGQTTCFEISCTYPMVKAWFDNPDMGVSFSGNQICISAPATGVFGSQTLWYDLQLLRFETVLGKQRIRKTSISHLYKSVSECDSSQCCGCTGISIGYTTQQMAVSTQQTLTAVGAVAGCTYNWAIASGGGSLSSGTGTSVVYTAPATNAECANNPTITLSCGGAQCDSLQIAVNAYTGNFAFYVKRCYRNWSCIPDVEEYCPIVRSYRGNCAGVETYLTVWCGGGYKSTPPVDCAFCAGLGRTSCAVVAQLGCAYDVMPSTWPIDSPYDIRSAAYKTAGCCPAALL